MVEPPDSTSTFSVESALDAEMVRDALTAYELDTLYDDESAYELLIANDAVVAREDDTDQLPVPTNAPRREPVYEPVNGAVSELNCNDDDTNAGLFATLIYSTYDDVTAWEAVPRSCDAVMPAPMRFMPLLDTVNDPVMIALPLYGNPTPDDTLPVNDPLNEPE